MRAAHPAEGKASLSELRASDEDAIEASRSRLGVALDLALRDVLAWSRTARPGDWWVVSKDVRKAVESELLTTMAMAYFDGARQHEEMMARLKPRSLEPKTWFTPTGEAALERVAARKAESLLRAAFYFVPDAIDRAFDLLGGRVKSKERVEAEIASGVASWFESGLKLARRGRSMKVRDRAAFERWVALRVPYQKWLRTKASDEGAAAKKLSERATRRFLQTERTRYLAHGAYDAAQLDPMVTSLMWSTMQDEDVCAACDDRDGIVRPKDDPWWVENMMPIHEHDRCRLIPIARSERIAVTPLATIRDEVDESDVQPGFGMYNRDRVRSGKRLGLKKAGGGR